MINFHLQSVPFSIKLCPHINKNSHCLHTHQANSTFLAFFYCFPFSSFPNNTKSPLFGHQPVLSPPFLVLLFAGLKWLFQIHPHLQFKFMRSLLIDKICSETIICLLEKQQFIRPRPEKEFLVKQKFIKLRFSRFSKNFFIFFSHHPLLYLPIT